jgi:hypothetical protein
MNFTVNRMVVTCAQTEAEAREYTMVRDRTRNMVWFYTLEDYDPAGHIYVHHTDRLDSQGFGGRCIEFKIAKTGESYLAQGPWHSNADALYDGTGVDLREMHLTFVCIAKGRRWTRNGQTVLTDVLYIDKRPTLGLFERGRLLAQKMANELGHPVCCYSESGGGSSEGFEYPTGTKWQDWTQWFAAQPEMTA